MKETRTDDGCYVINRKEGFPQNIIIESCKRRAKAWAKTGNPYWCAKCKNPGENACDLNSIGNTGICIDCYNYFNNQPDILIVRDPSIEEVLERWRKIKHTGECLTTKEIDVVVLRYESLELKCSEFLSSLKD